MVRKIYGIACATLLIASFVGPVAEAQLDDPRAPQPIPSNIENLLLENKIDELIRVIDRRVIELLTMNPNSVLEFENRLVSEIYVPTECDPTGKVVTRAGKEYPDTPPRTKFDHYGQTITVGSPEFFALTEQVETNLSLPMICDANSCEVTIPKSLYDKSWPVLIRQLENNGFVNQPVVYPDVLIQSIDWCTQSYAPVGIERPSYYYRLSDRTTIVLWEENHGRAKGSLRLRFELNSDPYCDEMIGWISPDRLPLSCGD